MDQSGESISTTNVRVVREGKDRYLKEWSSNMGQTKRHAMTTNLEQRDYNITQIDLVYPFLAILYVSSLICIMLLICHGSFCSSTLR